MDEEIEMLLNMGFNKHDAEHAVKATFGQGIEAAINWILSHPQNPNADEKGKEQQELQLQSEQNKPVPQMEEQKQEQVHRLEQKLKERRLQRQKEEMQRSIKQDKQRLETAKELSKARNEQAALEMQRLAEQKLKEKLQDKKRRNQIREELAKDRAERHAAQREAQRLTTRLSENSRQVSTSGGYASISIPHASTPTDSQSHDNRNCQIQVRIRGREPLRATFRPSDLLELLFQQLSSLEGVPSAFELVQSFPRRSFTSQADAMKTFSEAGLVPTAALHLRP
eukprot:gene9169-1462_t